MSKGRFSSAGTISSIGSSEAGAAESAAGAACRQLVGM